MTKQQAAENPRAPFGLATPHMDADLAGLFALLRLSSDPLVRIQISQIANKRLRELYPLGCGTIGTIHLTNGLTFNVDLGDQFGAHFHFGHLNEAAFLSALSATLPAGAKTVDVGGNFGLYAVHAAYVGGKEARVVAFEPLPSARGLLNRNSTENGLGGRIIVRPEAVSDESGKAVFHAAIEGAFSGLHDTGRSPIGHAFETATIALDACNEVTELGPVDFFKIDVEGHEAGVMIGARQLIARSPNILVSLEYSHKNLTADARSAILGEIDSHLKSGFRAWVLDDDSEVSELKAVDQISSRLSGTLVLAAPGCAWADDLLAAFARHAPWFNMQEVLHGVERIVGQLRSHEVERANLEAVLSRTEFTDADMPIFRRVKMLINTTTRQIKRLEERLKAKEKSEGGAQTGGKDGSAGDPALQAQQSQKITQLRTMLASTQAQSEKLATRNAHLEREYDALVAQAQRDHSDQRKQAKSEAPLQKQVDALSREIADLRQAIEAACTTQLARQKDVATLTRAVSKRDERIAKAEQDLIEAKSLIHALETRLAARKKFYDALEAEFAAFREKASAEQGRS
jgi:FkbM family methyltransferase